MDGSLKLSEGRLIAAVKGATFARLSHGADRLLLEGLANQVAISGPPLRGPGSPGDWGSTPAGPPNRLLETLSTMAVNRRGPPPFAARRAGYPWTEQMDRKMLRNVEIRGVHAAENGPSSDRKYWQRLELGIRGLNRWTIKCLEMSRKRGVRTDKTPRARTDVLAAP